MITHQPWSCPLCNWGCLTVEEGQAHHYRALVHINQVHGDWVGVTEAEQPGYCRVRCLECGQEDQIEDGAILTFKTHHLRCRVNDPHLLDCRLITRHPFSDDYLTNNHQSWANGPELKMLLDQYPTFPDRMEWEHRGPYYRVRHPAGWVKYLYHSNPAVQQEGFGGTHYTICVKGEGVVTLKGPWSGSSAGHNELWPEDPVTEVSVLAGRSWWYVIEERLAKSKPRRKPLLARRHLSHTLSAGYAITLEGAQRLVPWLGFRPYPIDGAVGGASLEQAAVIGHGLPIHQPIIFYIPRLILPDSY